MAELLSSKIIIQEEEPRIRSFPVLPTAVLAIQGIAERGPIADPQLITSFEEYSNIFGNYLANYQLALAVRSFFLNGGRQCYVSRTCHFSDLNNAASYAAAIGTVTLQTDPGFPSPATVVGTTTGPWVLSAGDTLIGSVDGNPDQTATFSATAGNVTDTTAYPTADQSGLTLLVSIDGGSDQTITFPAGTDTAAEVVDVINAQIDYAKAEEVGGQVKITSDKKGTSSSVAITGGTCALTWAAPVAGGGNVADIKAVTIAEVETIVEAAWTNGGGVEVTSVSGRVQIATVDTGVAATLQVQVASTADGIFGLDNSLHTGSDATAQDTLTVDGKTPGAYANSLKAKIGVASSGYDYEFNLYILKNTTVVESFANVTMNSLADRYVISVVNAAVGSNLVALTDENVTPAQNNTEALAYRPADTSGASLTAGDDGLTGLVDNDFVGTESGKTGLFAFDLSDDITLLACPDNVTSTVQKAMVNYCQITRKLMAFAILDPGTNLTASGIISQKDNLGSEGNSEQGALYWPRVKIINPDKTVYGDVETVTICPSGIIAGVMATDDNNYTEGPFFQPAGTEGGRMLGVVDLEVQEVRLESKRDLVFPRRINPISYLRSYGIFIDGARTMKGDGNFPSVGERRGVSHIERLLETGLQWVRHRNNTPALRRAVYRQVTAELIGWMRRGAFASENPSTAFFVDVSDALNPPSTVRAGQLVVRIGLATNTPAEFIIIKVVKDTRALEEELFGSL